MRTAHIISRDSKSVKLVIDGRFSEVSEKYKSLSPKDGEAIELWASGYQTKVKRGSKAETKKA